ncbi:MAG TPA: hypothetical protein VF030_02765 [Solirubrobacterales bacterium]
MRISSKFRLFAVCLTALGAMSVTGASAASAAPALFNVAEGVSAPALMSGSLTVSSNAESTTCNVVNRKLQATNKIGTGVLSTSETFSETTTCANGGTFSLNFVSPASNTGSGFLVTNVWTGYSARAPFAVKYYGNAGYAIAFVNGAGATESKLVLNEVTLGNSIGGPIKATGTLNVRKADGSLLLLS